MSRCAQHCSMLVWKRQSVKSQNFTASQIDDNASNIRHRCTLLLRFRLNFSSADRNQRDEASFSLSLHIETDSACKAWEDIRECKPTLATRHGINAAVTTGTPQILMLMPISLMISAWISEIHVGFISPDINIFQMSKWSVLFWFSFSRKNKKDFSEPRKLRTFHQLDCQQSSPGYNMVYAKLKINWP